MTLYMKKIFDEDEVWFAILWIAIYVVGFGNADSLSESIGIPKLLTVVLGLILSVILLRFIRKNQLSEYFGLCGFKGNFPGFLWFLPLAALSCVNLWNGLTLNCSVMESVLYVLSMCFVGFLEEVIFRGLLFKGMCASNVKTALLVSSITFGMGHIVNLLLGEPLLDTLLQLVYASAMGFCYTAIFYAGGSILPCILSHAFVNSTSVFAVEPSGERQILTAVFQTVLSVGYGVWLLRGMGEKVTK